MLHHGSKQAQLSWRSALYDLIFQGKVRKIYGTSEARSMSCQAGNTSSEAGNMSSEAEIMSIQAGNMSSQSGNMSS